MCDNQCCAYLGNKRCSNQAVGNSNHCDLHRTKATKLYLKYKSLCEKVENIDLDTNDMNYVMDCYNSLNKAYKARQKHRQYAFVPECYDSGHLYQLEKLNKQMEACEKILMSYKEVKNVEDVDDVDDVVKEKQTFKLEIKHQVKDFKRYRREQAAETNQLINHYINENAVILQNRGRLISLIINYVDQLYEEIDVEDEMDYFVKHVTTYTLVNYICRSGYFHPQFKPERCSDITCGCYIPYDAALACSCILHHHSVDTYFNMNNEKSLKKYYEILLLYHSKIIPILNDVMDLYGEHEDRLMFLKVHLVWHHDLKRLVLEPNFDEELPKMSKLFAQSRLKNKFYYQKMQQEYLTGK